MIHYWLQYIIFFQFGLVETNHQLICKYPIEIYVFSRGYISRYHSRITLIQSGKWMKLETMVSLRGGGVLHLHNPKNHLEKFIVNESELKLEHGLEGRIRRVWRGKRFSIGWIYHLKILVLLWIMVILKPNDPVWHAHTCLGNLFMIVHGRFVRWRGINDLNQLNREFSTRFHRKW